MITPMASSRRWVPDGLQPFKYATVEASQMLEQIEASLQQLLKKGDQ